MERKSPAIIFDFGGVLIDWNPRYLYQKLFTEGPEAMESFLTEIGFIEWNLQQDKGRPFAQAVAELCERFPHYGDHIRAYDERWEESIGGQIQESVTIVDLLRKAGYPLYGLSNWSAETFRRIRHKHEFLDWFEVIIISGEVGMVKPDAGIFLELLKRIGRRADECLFIDDSEANIAAAERLGFAAIRFESPDRLRRALQELGILAP